MNAQDEGETLLFKILIIGASGVGKSSLFVRYTKNEFSEKMMSTLGYDLKIKQIKVGRKNVKLQLWDAAGDPKFKNVAPSYFKGCHGILVVYDITDEKSFQAIEDIAKDVENYAPKDAIVYLVGNKCDLESKRQVSKEAAFGYAAEKSCAYFETSAKTAAQVDETFNNMAERLVNQAKPYDFNESFKLKNDNNKKTDLRDKVCCAYY